MFAAKEAAFKALKLPLGDWHVLEIGHEPSGRSQAALGPDYDSAMLSISI
jgi:phosphopantetheinyl transferase (holo-ACP synthase)